MTESLEFKIAVECGERRIPCELNKNTGMYEIRNRENQVEGERSAARFAEFLRSPESRRFERMNDAASIFCHAKSAAEELTEQQHGPVSTQDAVNCLRSQIEIGLQFMSNKDEWSRLVRLLRSFE